MAPLYVIKRANSHIVDILAYTDLDVIIFGSFLDIWETAEWRRDVLTSVGLF